METNPLRLVEHRSEDESKSSSPSGPPPSDVNQSAETDAYADLQEVRVVICEDEGVTQMQLRRCLAHAGLSVVGTAINGQDSVNVVLRERPDIVLMDIRMPGIDGLEATRRILESYPVCIIMLTAYNDDKYRQQALALGASAYVVKPITSDMLLPLMSKALRAFHLGQPSQV